LLVHSNVDLFDFQRLVIEKLLVLAGVFFLEMPPCEGYKLVQKIKRKKGTLCKRKKRNVRAEIERTVKRKCMENKKGVRGGVPYHGRGKFHFWWREGFFLTDLRLDTSTNSLKQVYTSPGYFLENLFSRKMCI
jgi:hypothetical protein